MKPRKLTATDPCPQCGGFDASDWPANGPGWAWRCVCDSPNRTDEPRKEMSWTSPS